MSLKLGLSLEMVGDKTTVVVNSKSTWWEFFPERNDFNYEKKFFPENTPPNNLESVGIQMKKLQKYTVHFCPS